MGQEEEIKPIDKTKEKPIDQTQENPLVAEILASLEESQLTVRSGISRDGMSRTPYRLSKATVGGHEVELIIFGRSLGGEKRLKIDGQKFDSPEIIDKMNLLSKAIVEQSWKEHDEKELANKNLMADISDGLETATITSYSATEMRGSTKVRLFICEGEVAGHKIKSVGGGTLFIDDKAIPHSTDLLTLIQKIQGKAQVDASIAETRKKIEDEPSA